MRKLRITALVVLVSGTVLLSGCASIVNGEHQSISVTTPPTTEAHCSLTNSKGIWFVNHTPGSVLVHRAYGELTVKCDKKGFLEGESKIKSHTKGMAFGNILFGGIVGAGVDVGTGAAYDYPNKIVVPMVKLCKGCTPPIVVSESKNTQIKHKVV